MTTTDRDDELISQEEYEHQLDMDMERKIENGKIK